ncbi:hypothetical protein QQ020_22330 [Fulvivirgaceae bacterium BMA12]|uniref:Uncharacterized protein n=1 Tax=Agaribacillus aureus TaxID=3051825 RepID=A0ABT8LAP9_9BACT|nr:hypothetical protein [Fulvivirgaceae bacterium BMA12]
MKTKVELEKELEKLNYRYTSLIDIPNRREMTQEEEQELELLDIRITDLKQVLKQKVAARRFKFASVGKTITLLAAIMFSLLTVYATTSAYQFMLTETSVEKQVMMGITTILTFCLTIGATYAYSRQYKLEWK